MGGDIRYPKTGTNKPRASGNNTKECSIHIILRCRAPVSDGRIASWNGVTTLNGWGDQISDDWYEENMLRHVLDSYLNDAITQHQYQSYIVQRRCSTGTFHPWNGVKVLGGRGGQIFEDWYEENMFRHVLDSYLNDAITQQ